MPLQLTLGDAFPDVELLDHSGSTVKVSAVVNQRPTILAFYRGYW